MSIKAKQLETAILARLRQHAEGRRNDSLAEWSNSLEKTLGERPINADIVAALMRFRNNGLVSLSKYIPEQNLWYVYAKDEQVDDRWFFYMTTFTVAITDEGRGSWDVPSTPIGFQKPA
jgi:hypothetical protein